MGRGKCGELSVKSGVGKVKGEVERVECGERRE
jgi:hypothetical protein